MVKSQLSLFINMKAVIVGAFIMAVASYARNQDLLSIALSSPLISIVCIFFVREATAFIAIISLGFAYSLGAYIGALNEINFYPRPGINVYELAAIEQSMLLLFTLGLGLASGVGVIFQRALVRSWHVIKSYGHLQSSSKALIAVALLIGLHDLVFVAANLGSILSGGRHTYRDSFWVGNGPVGIVLAISVSVALIGMLFRGSKRIMPTLALAVFWVPSLIAGSRNYVSILGIIFLSLLLLQAKKVMTRTLVMLGAFLAVYLLILLPTFWSENEQVGYNEWILPTSSYLPIFMGIFSIDEVGATPILQQWSLLLPSFLRPGSVDQYAEVFAALGVTNVGVAGNPWAEAFVASPTARLWLFAGITLLPFVTAIILSRIAPFAPLITVGVMAFWGRSSLWNTLFIVVYSSIALAVYYRIYWPNKKRRIVH